MNSRMAWTLGLVVLGAGAMVGCETTIDASGGAGGSGSTSSATTTDATTTTSATTTTNATTTSTGSGVTADQACADYASALCGERDACTNGFFTTRDYGDLAACEARQKQECLTRLDAGGTSLDTAQLEACASAFATFPCGDFLNSKLPAACVPQPGSVADGGACAFGAQCATAFCASASDESCGACAPAPKPGDSCAEDTGCGVGSGLRCLASTGTCVVPASAGSTCMESAECRNELSCVVPAMGMPGTCQPAGATVGATCDGKGVGAPTCDRSQGLDCKMGVCVEFTFAAAGEACGASVSAVCSSNGMCLGPNGAKTCVAAVADGAACDTEAGPPCSTPAHCVSDGTSTAGVCALLDAAVCM